MPRSALIAAAAAGLIVRLLFGLGYWVGQPLTRDEREYLAMARTIAGAPANPHAPDEYRTNLVLQDLPEFAKSFKCKKDAKMVSPAPCRVW